MIREIGQAQGFDGVSRYLGRKSAETTARRPGFPCLRPTNLTIRQMNSRTAFHYYLKVSDCTCIMEDRNHDSIIALVLYSNVTRTERHRDELNTW